MFTKSLAEKWSSDGIRTFSVHPGMVSTNILNRAPDLYLKLNCIILPLFGKNCWQGAQTQIHCCLSDDLINGAFYMDCRPVSCHPVPSQFTVKEICTFLYHIHKIFKKVLLKQDDYFPKAKFKVPVFAQGVPILRKKLLSEECKEVFGGDT